MARCEADKLAELIIRTHDGKVMFNLGETSKIVGQGLSSISSYLHSSGITVKKVGQEKMINAYQIAEYMCKDRIAPVDNESRGLVRKNGF
jgi:hypothetical protein